MDSLGFSARQEDDCRAPESRRTDVFQRAFSPAEQKYLKKRLPKGFTLVQKQDLRKQTPKTLRPGFAPLAQIADDAPKEKRIGPQNQHLREQPWTGHCVQTIQKLLQIDFGAASRSRAKRNNMTGNQLKPEFQAFLQQTLEAIRKKLLRGDFIGASHFVREVKLVCLGLRSLPNASHEAVDAALRLEQAFLALYENSQAVDAVLRQAATARSKVENRRKKPATRKGSDQFGSKQTAETDNRVSRGQDRLRVEAELSRKLSGLRGDELAQVWRILVKHDEGLSRCSSDDRVEITLEHLSDAALSELAEYARGLATLPRSRPKPKKPAQKTGVSQATPVETADSSNSSFLTGTRRSSRLRPRLDSRQRTLSSQLNNHTSSVYRTLPSVLPCLPRTVLSSHQRGVPSQICICRRR